MNEGVTMAFELAGREVDIVWHGRRARAFVPTPLAQRDLTVSTATLRRTTRAVAEIEHAASDMTTEFEPLARLLIRSEGVASSFIEGILAPVVDIVLVEEHLAHGGSVAAWVAANLAAVTEAVGSASGDAPLTSEMLGEWHRTLMAGSPVPERYVGTYRTEQGWIGGTDPTVANLVTPPAEEIEGLVSDLVEFVNRDDLDLDPVTQAGIAHAQFEIVHPFADGNGRIGRMLVAWMLTRRLSLVAPPPVSVAIAGDVGGYASGLTMYRFGQLDKWVSWFADAVRSGGRAQSQLVKEVEGLKGRWRQRLASPDTPLRSDATAWVAVDLLPRHLVLTSPIVAAELGISNKVAIDALEDLVSAGVLLDYGRVAPLRRGQPPRLFVSRELLALAGSSPLR